MRPKPADRRRMSEVRSELFRLQQIVVPQRDMLGRGGDLLENLPGLERDVARHPFRDVHDDLVVTANEIDYLRELLSETRQRAHQPDGRPPDHRRHDLPAADLRHRLLRDELRLAGRATSPRPSRS